MECRDVMGRSASMLVAVRGRTTSRSRSVGARRGRREGARLHPVEPRVVPRGLY